MVATAAVTVVVMVVVAVMVIVTVMMDNGYHVSIHLLYLLSACERYIGEYLLPLFVDTCRRTETSA